MKSGWPLPLGAVANRRSLIYIGNLVDAISLSARHPAAANKTFLLSDGDDVSTPELIGRIASAFGVPARLLSVPEPWLRQAGTLLRKGPAVDRLLGSLMVDASAIRRDLGWSPPLTMQQGLAESGVIPLSRTYYCSAKGEEDDTKKRGLPGRISATNY